MRFCMEEPRKLFVACSLRFYLKTYFSNAIVMFAKESDLQSHLCFLAQEYCSSCRSESCYNMMRSNLANVFLLFYCNQGSSRPKFSF